MSLITLLRRTSQRADPDADKVVLFMPFEGNANDTVFVDTKGKPITRNGNAILSNNFPLQGKTSLFLDGSDRTSLVTPGHIDFSFGNKDFCVDFWMRPIATSLQRLLFIYNTSVNGSVFGLYQNATSIVAGFSADDLPDGHGSKVNLTPSAGGLLYNQSNHIAFNRVGNAFRVWVNGNPGPTVTSSISMTTALYPLYIGARYYSAVGKPIEMYNGYMDLLRITKGAGRFTAPFNPNTLRY